MKANNRESLGIYLTKLRLAKKLTQWDVAVAMGYKTAQFVSNWERGVSFPSCKDVRRLSSVLGVSARDLIGEVWSVKQGELDREFQLMLGNLHKRKTTKSGSLSKIR